MGCACESISNKAFQNEPYNDCKVKGSEKENKFLLKRTSEDRKRNPNLYLDMAFYTEVSLNSINKKDQYIKNLIDFNQYNDLQLINKVECYLTLKKFINLLNIDDLYRLPTLEYINETNEHISKIGFINFFNYLCEELSLKTAQINIISEIYNDLKPSISGLHRKQILYFLLRMIKIILDSAFEELQIRKLIFQTIVLLYPNDRKSIEIYLNNIQIKSSDDDINQNQVIDNGKLNFGQSMELIKMIIQNKFKLKVVKNVDAVFEEKIYPMISMSSISSMSSTSSMNPTDNSNFNLINKEIPTLEIINFLKILRLSLIKNLNDTLHNS